MKLWIVNQYAIPPTESGGTRHYSLARGLVAQGVEVEVFASTRSYLANTQIARAGHTDFDGVGFTFLEGGGASANGGKAGRFGSMIAFARAFRAHALGRPDGPDVILGSTPTLFAAWAARGVARQRGVPFVLEVRDIWPQTLVDLGGYAPWHPGVVLFGAMERRLYRSADHIVSLLPYAAAHIAERGGRAEGVTWIPNGMDLMLAGATGDGACGLDGAECGTPEKGKPFTVTYAGAHGLANALGAVLDAAALLQARHGKRFRFVLLGDGHEKAALQRRAEAERLDIVSFEPAVPKAEVHRHLTAADALIVNMNPGGLYRFGISFNKLYDYLAAARPVVFGTDSANNPIEEAGAGLSVRANDGAAMADAVERLASLSAAERRAMGERGRTYVQAHHDTGVLSARLARVLEEVTHAA